MFSTEARSKLDDFELATDRVTNAEFRIAEDGQVKEMGVLLEPEMGEGKIWFEKVGAEDSDGLGKGFRAGSHDAGRERSRVESEVEGQRKLFSRLGRGVAPLFT